MIRTLAFATVAFTLSVSAASATVCKDGTRLRFTATTLEYTKKECDEKHGGWIAVCYDGQPCRGRNGQVINNIEGCLPGTNVAKGKKLACK